MMKRLGLVILCCFLLAGCITDPVFDTSSWTAYQTSLAAIKAKLSNDDLRRLEVALRYLLMESLPGFKIDGQLLEAPSGTYEAARGNLSNSYLVLARLGPRINGSSAAAVIKNVSIKLDAEIADTEERLPGVEGVLGSVEIDAPRYYWRRSGFSEQPVIEFTVRNVGKSAISRVFFSSVLTSPNRAIPWARQEFVQTFRGGLEPREKQQLTIQPSYAAWNDPQLKYLSDAELKVIVTNYIDANEQSANAVDTGSLDIKRKVRAALR